MAERPQELKIGAHPFGDKERAFNVKGLPRLQLSFRACNRKVEKGIGEARLSLIAFTHGLLHHRLRLTNITGGTRAAIGVNYPAITALTLISLNMEAGLLWGQVSPSRVVELLLA